MLISFIKKIRGGEWGDTFSKISHTDNKPKNQKNKLRRFYELQRDRMLQM